MKSGICPKCRSTEIYGNTGNTHGIGVDPLAFPQLNTILLTCTDCGNLEFYVQDEAKLAKLKEKFGKVVN